MEREKLQKEKFYAAKKPMKIWDVNANNIVILKLVKRKTKFKYLIGIKFDKAMRPLVLVMPKMSWYVKVFNVGDRINKLMPFHKDDEKLLQ